MYDDAVAFCAARGEPRRARPADPRRASLRSAIPGQPSHPICHGVGARAHEPPYAHQAGRRRGARGHGSCNRARVLLARGRRPPRRGQLPHHRDRSPRSCAASPTGSWRWAHECHVTDRHKARSRHDDRSRQALDGQPEPEGARPAAARHRRALRHDAARRRADGRRRPLPEDKLEIARALDAAGIDRIEAGLPPRLGRRLARRRARSPARG